jgi:hypothetical protein
MATNVTVRDLENYPDNFKSVTVDQSTLVPTGARGDEKWVSSFTTTAYSNNTNLTAIQDIYVQEFKAGWYKSSGLVSGPFIIQSGRQWLGVQIDANSNYYIQLDAGTYGGDSLASHIEDKIRAIPTASGTWIVGEDDIAYKNTIVDYVNGKFIIVSGNVGEFYTGVNRTSVAVTASGSDTLFGYLSFKLGTSSESVASNAPTQTMLSVNYTAGGATLVLASDIGFAAKDSGYITDGTNSDYFTVISGSGVTWTVPTTGTNGFNGIANSYTAGEAKVMRLRLQDPDQEPVYYHNTVDSIVRWGIASLVNQIDFSS